MTRDAIATRPRFTLLCTKGKLVVYKAEMQPVSPQMFDLRMDVRIGRGILFRSRCCFGLRKSWFVKAAVYSLDLIIPRRPMQTARNH